MLTNPGMIVFRWLDTLIEVSKIMCGSNRYLSDSSQRLEIITMEVLAVIRDLLIKDQGRYDKPYSVMSRHQTWQIPISRFWSLEFGICQRILAVDKPRSTL